MIRVETLRGDLLLGTLHFSGEGLHLEVFELELTIHDDPSLKHYLSRSQMKTYLFLIKVSEGAADSTSSSTTASWTSNGVAPATPDEIKVASYLIISAAVDDFIPEVNNTVPRKLNHFIGEVNDGTVSDASLKLAKDWLDTTGRCPHYINPVHAVLVSKYNLFLTMSETYTWRTKITASQKDSSRLCASFNGKHKTSRLKTMLPSVAHFILAQGPINMWTELVAAREADKQSSGQSSKTAIMHHLTRCLRTVLFGTVRYFSTVP